MQNIKLLVFLMMFLTLSCRCIIHLMPSLGLPWISTILSVSCILILCYCIFQAFRNNLIIADKRQICLFLIYYGIVAYQLFFSGIIKFSQCEGVPDSEFDFFRGTFDILLLSLSTFLVTRYLDFHKFAKLTVVLTLIYLLIYNYRIGFTWYSIAYGMNPTEFSRIKPDFFVDGLTMNGFVGLMLCCNLYIFEKWTSNKFWSYAIFIAIVVLGFIIQSLLVERGPLLFLMITMFIMLTAKGSMNKELALFLTIVFLLFIFFSDELISLFRSYAPEMAEKFTDTNGSGRYGEANSIYSLAIKQIFEHPLFGYSCRFNDGSYAHNIILELLMTVGCVIAIPIIYLMYKAFIQSYKLIKYSRPEALVGIIFIYKTLCLMTSQTILCNTQFWFSFAFVLTTIKYVDFSEESVNYSK